MAGSRCRQRSVALGYGGLSSSALKGRFNFPSYNRSNANPFRNRSFVIGIADKPFSQTGRFPGEIATPNGGWNWGVCRYKRLRLPFIAYSRGRFQFYCGWRKGGNFGMKFNFGGSKQQPQPKT